MLHATTTFVGRAVELRAISDALTRVLSGRPALVAIHGPAGIGKTALAAAVCANAKGFRVAAASGDRSEIFLDFGVVDQLRRQLPNGRAKPATNGAGMAQRQPPFAVGAEILELIGQLEDQPVLVLLDDAHWADESSLQALSFAFRRLQVDRVAFVVTLRDEEAQTLPRSFVRMLNSPYATHFTLSGLSPIEVRELVQRHSLDLSHRAVDRLHGWTAGNPLHVKAMLSELDPDAIERNLDAPLPAPRSVTDVVLSRLDECSPEARRVIEAASVLGVRCSRDHLFGLVGIDQPLAAIDLAIQSGLLACVGVGAATEVRFAHPLIAAAVYHSIPLAPRAVLHRRAATIVGEQAVGLRHEVLACTGPDPGLADRLEAFAHREAAITSWTVAAAALEQAARLSTTAEQRGRRLLDATDCWLNSAEAPVSTLVDQVRRLPESAQQEYVLARVSWMTGSTAAAEKGFHRAWAMLDSPQSTDLTVRIAASLGTLYVNAGRATDAVVWAGRALAAQPAEATPSDWAVLSHLWGLAMRGDAEVVLRKVSQLPSDPRLAMPHQMEELIGRGVAHFWSGNPIAARPDLECGVQLARDRAALQVLIPTLCFLADADYRVGEWDVAVLHGEHAASMAEDINLDAVLAQAHAIASFAQSARGQWESAEGHAAAAKAISERVGDLGGLSYSALARARLELFRNNPAAAVIALTPLLSMDAEPLVNPAVHPWRLTLADAYCRLVRLEEAETCMAQAEREIRHGPCRSEFALLGRVKAEILARQGDARAAAHACEAALIEADRPFAPFEFACLELSSGSILRRLGHRREAKQLLESARETLAHLGAAPLLARCEAELAGTGLRPVHRTADSRRLLTSQELAVARLAAEGLTNKEIAAHLVISPRTVDYHLGHVFAKLEIEHRAQLSRSFPTFLPASGPA